MDESKRVGFFSPRTATVKHYVFKREYSQAELAAETRDLALEPTLELFRRFRWDAPVEVVRSMQAELRL